MEHYLAISIIAELLFDTCWSSSYSKQI